MSSDQKPGRVAVRRASVTPVSAPVAPEAPTLTAAKPPARAPSLGVGTIALVWIAALAGGGAVTWFLEWR